MFHCVRVTEQNRKTNQTAFPWAYYTFQNKMMNAVLSSSSLENEKTNMPHLYVTYQCYDIFYGMAIKIYIRPNINIR